MSYVSHIGIGPLSWMSYKRLNSFKSSGDINTVTTPIAKRSLCGVVFGQGFKFPCLHQNEKPHPLFEDVVFAFSYPIRTRQCLIRTLILFLFGQFDYSII